MTYVPITRADQRVPDANAIIDVSGQRQPHDYASLRMNRAGAIKLRKALSRLIEENINQAAQDLFTLFDSEGEAFELHLTIAPSEGLPGYDSKLWEESHYLGLEDDL